MTFPTSIQALLGANTPDNSSNTQSVPNWSSMVGYIYGPNPSTSAIFLATQNMNSGAELSAVSAGTFMGGNAPGGWPLGFDTAGNLYIANIFQQIAQINSSTLVQIQQGAVGFSAAQGAMAGLQATDGTKWILVLGEGGQSSFEKHVCLSVTALAGWTPGIVVWGNRTAVCCAGPAASGLGWVCVGPQNTGDTEVLDLHKVNVNTGVQANTVVGHVNPTDIDAGWTEIYVNGICLDQTDGNLIVALQGQAAATNLDYLAKLSKTDASVSWKTAMPNASFLASSMKMMQYSVVQNSRFYYFNNQGSPGGEVTVVNTSTGAIVDQYTTGVANLLLHSGGFASNDNLGAVLANFGMSGAGGPVLRNSTPAAFGGWALLYVASGPLFPPASAGRKFLAELGPVRVNL